MHRREVLAVGGGVTALMLAGCSGGEEAPREPKVDGWFNGVRNYEGFEDHTGKERVTVLVGAGEVGTAFEPPAISVAPGTTVVFEWTGRGGEHNVEQPDDEWSNPEGVLESDEHTWEREFTDPGTHRYQCWPHVGVGMKGAIFVDAYADENEPENGSADNASGE